MNAYYNETEPYACEWLRNLIAEGLIAGGDVDERPIQDVRAEDLKGYTQAHFFAGLGGWSYALRLAGWPDDRPVWTGSCPCQPFSAAGKQEGEKDERHLWPDFRRLIEACRPPIIFGEQVASAGVVGKTNTHLPEMSDREAVFGVLRELQGQTPHGMQGVRPRSGTRPQAPKPTYEREVQSVARCEPGPRIGQCGQAQGEEAGAPLHAGGGGHTGSYRRRSLRNDGHTLRPIDASCMELPFVGSDRTGPGVHGDEYEGCPLCAECDGQHLGRAENCGDCGCDYGEAAGEVERLIAAHRGEPETRSGWPWFSAICADLERAHYAVGACDLPAAGAGAPHIRQRLWFVGVADSAGSSAGREAASTARHRDTAEPAGGTTIELADANGGDTGTERLQRSGQHGREPQGGRAELLADTLPARRSEGRTGAGNGSVAGGGSPIELGDTARGEQRRARITEESERREGSARGSSAWSDCLWLPCTDGKQRPTLTRLQYVVDGLSPRMVALCPAGEEEVADAAFTDARSDQALRGVRKTADPQEVQERARGHGSLPPPEVLRPDMHGKRDGGEDQGSQSEERPSSVWQGRQGRMRELWQDGASTCSPQERKPAEQCAIQFDDFVRLLPSAGPLAKLCGDARTEEAVQALLKASETARPLLHSPDALQKVWRSVVAESEDRLRVALAAGGWVIVPVSPLAHGIPARVAKLRAAGNAIVPQTAAAFIKAAM